MRARADIKSAQDRLLNPSQGVDPAFALGVARWQTRPSAAAQGQPAGAVRE